MKSKIYQLWEKGYLYIIVASLLCVLYSTNKRVGIYDWRKEIIFFQYIKTSFNTFHCFPFFWWLKLSNLLFYPSVSHTSSFIGNPETMLFSPLTPLLLFVNVIYYIKLLYVVHFIAGVAGILMLRDKLKWNDLQFRTYAALFLFSPIIIQHMATGYTPWLNLFFFPLLVYFLACRRILFSSFGISVILALTLLQGGTHIFIWFVIFVILYDISSVFLERNLRYLFHIIIVITLAPLLSFIRIYATVQAYADFHQPFQPGYNPINFLVWAIIPPVLIAPLNMFFLDKVWFGVPSWDGAIFWGLTIVMIPLTIINYKNYRNSLVPVELNEEAALNYDSLLISSSVLFCLSFFSVFELFIKAVNAVLHAPFVEGAEKYPFRLMIPAFLGFSVLIAHFSPNIWRTIDKWLKNKWGGNIVSRHTVILLLTKSVMYFSIVLFVVLAFAVVLGFIFAPVILSAFINMMKNAYNGTGSRWLAQRTGHIEQMAVVTTYFQLRIAVLIVSVFSLVTFLILRGHSKHTSSFEKRSCVFFEMVLVLPLLFSSLMWFSLALSNPHTIYETSDAFPPYVKISTNLPGLEIDMAVTPRELTIYPPKNSKRRQYILGIPAADSKFLELTSKNASLSTLNGQIAILPHDNNPVVLTVKSANYKRPLHLTITAWVGLICVSIVGGFLRRRTKKSRLG